MLQIRSSDDGKSEWNMSEAQIIIPMIDGDLLSSKESDKILTSAVTLNALEGGDQAILTNALEHSLVVGLDKNLFDSTNYKSDLLIIQNSDLKLLPCSTDLKLAYTLSNVDQDKNEIVWQNPVVKDRICMNDKAIFEIRQVLNYNDADLEKSKSQISLENVSNEIASQITKTDKEVLIEEETISGEKSITDSQFIVNYTPEAGNSKSICISLSPKVRKPNPHTHLVEKGKQLQSGTQSELNVRGSLYKLGEEFEESVFNPAAQVVSYSDSSQVEFSNKTDVKEKIMTKKSQTGKETKLERDNWNDSLPEKNLPLKKKAKMKRTLMVVNSENHRSLLKCDMSAAQEVVNFPTRRKVKQLMIKVQEENNLNEGSESLVNKVSKRKKIKSSHSNSLVKEIKNAKEVSIRTNETASSKLKFVNFDETKFSNIYDLVEGLRKCRLINTTVWQILNSGLKEIKVDILKEINAKRNENGTPESSHYSPHLKAFALVLYFKQPAAFNYLSQVYKNGWPSLDVIKEWKRRMNTRHRRNFTGIQSDGENNK